MCPCRMSLDKDRYLYKSVFVGFYAVAAAISDATRMRRYHESSFSPGSGISKPGYLENRITEVSVL